ncbi:protein FAM169B isoform X1 [Scleropages formosus]|uniref:Family with sequence similarity 169 member B n=1 Tax=Scleropages formosus TaxID=113540 RepID=A0A8C9SJ66_SCLFO|nr:protein FAM169B isoform X1 [Scleropages formosus]
METGAERSRFSECYPVDVPSLDYNTMRTSAEKYLSNLESHFPLKNDSVLLPDGEELDVTHANVSRLLLFGDDDPAYSVLALHTPEDKAKVVALYLHGKWWALNDALKTACTSRSGLITVESPGERVVLFLLSQIIFGILERPINEGIYFAPHPAKEIAKILWQDGEAIGFYSVKKKGSLCDRYTSECYQLPVLDTVFVRKHWRRRGFALWILGDFCSSFSKEETVGISSPISANMYQVCSKYLIVHESQRDRLYEVEAPGNWSQRRNVWLNLQLGSCPGNYMQQNTIDGKNKKKKTASCQKNAQNCEREDFDASVDDSDGNPEPQRMARRKRVWSKQCGRD